MAGSQLFLVDQGEGANSGWIPTGVQRVNLPGSTIHLLKNGNPFILLRE